MNRIRSRRNLYALGTLVLLAGAFGAALGRTLIAPWDVWGSILGIGTGDYDFVVLTLRLPRVYVALLAGAALGLSGAVLQGVVRNPLASPDIIGITGGASAAAVAFLTFASGTVGIGLMPIAAILGAFLVSMLVYALAWSRGVTPLRLVFIGIGFSAATGAATTFMIVMSPIVTASEAYIWLTGSVYGAAWEDVRLIGSALLVSLPLLLLLARSLNIQSLGDESAIGLGVALQRHRFYLIGLSVLLAGTAVSTAGAVGFVGLVAPHLARLLVGHSFRGLLLGSAFAGGMIVFLADLVARVAFYPLDIPVGVFTAGVGAPFFLYLFYQNRNRF
ncbi:FecCD family ABC transporter permease [Cohnella thailandensis]|uniref:Iron ABC transporter permease n=1 Tax=Cohnella thailandensis TaxID=557557 RepID=A0A841SRY1_9BACL|nr:iron ABC transporter permease [Cohnella thailandensis]MBB6633699.1 iron ABC transporter permease [Cohnella thailandensis]MBP1976484.1 iron complex transport system permease protein [Cohnella thailandensis]